MSRYDKENKKIIYIDMDETFLKYKEQHKRYKKMFPDIEFPQSIQGFYSTLEPIKDSIRVIKKLINSDKYYVLFLTAPSEKNPISYSEKRILIELYFGFENVHRLIISAHKGLNKGDFLIDDFKEGKGQEEFDGKIIHYGVDVKNWKEIEKMFFD